MSYMWGMACTVGPCWDRWSSWGPKSGTNEAKRHHSCITLGVRCELSPGQAPRWMRVSPNKGSCTIQCVRFLTDRRGLWKGHKLVSSCRRCTLWGWLDILPKVTNTCSERAPNEMDGVQWNATQQVSELIHSIFGACIVFTFHRKPLSEGMGTENFLDH